jgi:hypothetical protein
LKQRGDPWLQRNERPDWADSVVTNEKCADHAQYRDDPDAFIPADARADMTDLTDLVSSVAVVEP